MPGFSAADALIRRPTRRGLAAAALFAIPVLPAIVFQLTDAEEYQFVAALVGCGEAIVFLLLPAIAPQGVLTGERRGAVRVEGGNIFFRARLALTRDEIESVWVESLPDDKRRVHFSAKRSARDLAVVVDDDARAKQLLDALALCHDRHAASFVVERATLRSRTAQRFFRGLDLLGGAVLSGILLYFAYREATVSFALVPVLFVYSALLDRLRLTTRVTVGADGIAVRSLGPRRQIAFTSILKVTRVKNDSVLSFDDGRVLRLRFAGRAAEDMCHAFTTRVHAGVARADRRSDPIARRLLPTGDDPREWLADLRRASGAHGYREGGVPVEELWRIVESPSADAAARAGACAALRPRIDETGRERLAEIAGATANQNARAALEAAAAGSTDEEILEAFAQGKAPPRE